MKDYTVLTRYYHASWWNNLLWTRRGCVYYAENDKSDSFWTKALHYGRLLHASLHLKPEIPLALQNGLVACRNQRAVPL